ncbi:MAG: flagellar basal body L-ring protein FlgH [Leptolyngbya sp. PLA1]|nr:flagellar basal body L-ring protein FlgH [Leptolyngbya sp. PLA1]
MKPAITLALLVPANCATPSLAQSLFLQPPQAPATLRDGTIDPAAPIREYSYTAVEAPKPTIVELNDKVTIIVSETSRQSSQEKLDTKTDTSFKAALKKFPDLAKFLEAELATGDSNPVVEVEAGGNRSFKGDGKRERSDTYSDRITATVIDVKPNGVLVVEARRVVQHDSQTQTLLLSGECRREDVTEQNTVLSSQLADLTIRVENEGDVKDTATKGWMTRVLEALFNF